MNDTVTRTRGTIGLRKIGTFGAYNVQGLHYCNESQSIGWYTTSSPGRDPIHNYWVSDGEFHAVRVGTPHAYSNAVEIEVLGLRDVSAEEKEAILAAITQWEREAEESL